MSREQLFRFFFLGAFIFLLYQIAHILSPFYTGILGAIVVALIFYPLHHWVVEKFHGRQSNLTAGLSTLSVVLIIMVPLLFTGWLLYKELLNIHPLIEEIGDKIAAWRHGEGGSFPEIEWLRGLKHNLQILLEVVRVDLQSFAKKAADDILNRMVGVGQRLPKNIFFFVVNCLIMVFTLYFLFRDGTWLLSRFKELVPMGEKHKEHIARQLYLTVTAVVRGLFIVALAQGALAAFGFFVARVPSPTLLGFFTSCFSLVPFVGAPSVWLPVSIYYLTQGMVGKGIFLLFWGTFVVSLVDNFLRPIVIGTRAKLPILFLFFGLLGGIKVYGVMGLFLGPLVVALVLAFGKIYREEYRTGSVEPEPKSLKGEQTV